MEVMKAIALVLATTILLGGVGWYLFNTIPVVEAPVASWSDLPQATSTVEVDPDLSDPVATSSVSDDSPAIPPNASNSSVDTFEECAAAGNPVMESYPRQCRHQGVLYIETVASFPTAPPVACTMDAKLCPDGSAVGRTGPNCEFARCPGEVVMSPVTYCSPESKLAEACTMEYAPVCGLVEIQCVTTPCNPIPQTFSNACSACSQGNVNSFTAGACELE